VKIVLSHAADKDVKRLPANLRKRIVTAIAKLPAGDVKKLQGREGYRLRVGDFRVLYEVEGDTITVLAVGPRGGIYR
jgi:mRNA interferase RelE/StbE